MANQDKGMFDPVKRFKTDIKEVRENFRRVFGF